MRSLIDLAGLAIACFAFVVLSSCGEGSPRTPDEATPGEIARCPTIIAGTSTNTRPATTRNLQGRFSEQCVRGLIDFPFVLPELAPRWKRNSFGFSADQPVELRVFFEPSGSGEPNLVLEIYPARLGLRGGSDHLVTPGGHEIDIGLTSLGLSASWTSGEAFYALQVVNGDRSRENEEIVAFVADAVFSEALVP